MCIFTGHRNFSVKVSDNRRSNAIYTRNSNAVNMDRTEKAASQCATIDITLPTLCLLSWVHLATVKELVEGSQQVQPVRVSSLYCAAVIFL